MSSPKKFYFDVWLAQGKTVYRDVPYEIVTDWIQQGRLLGDDRIRPAKTEEWFLIDKVPAFAGFVPKVDPLRDDPRQEALEPVESPFQWGHGEEEEGADPDMIPLIDVSLVLLIFFMITSTVASAVSKIRVPEASQQSTEITENVKMIWVGVNYISPELPAEYAVNIATEETRSAENHLNYEEAIKRIEDICERQIVPEIRVAAHRDLSFDLIRKLAIELEKYKSKGRVTVIKIEVGERK